MHDDDDDDDNDDDDDEEEDDDGGDAEEDADKSRFYIQMHRQRRSGFLFSTRLSNFFPLLTFYKFWWSTFNVIHKNGIFEISKILMKLQVKLRPAGPRWIVGRVQFARVHFSRLASSLRRSAQ